MWCWVDGWSRWRWIGQVLRVAAGGAGHRKAAAVVGRSVSTVRGWLRSFRAVADRVVAHFTVWAHVLDPDLGPIEPAGSVFADALEAIEVAARAASLRLGPRPAWSWVSLLTVGGSAPLSNTSSPWLAGLNERVAAVLTLTVGQHSHPPHAYTSDTPQ